MFFCPKESRYPDGLVDFWYVCPLDPFTSVNPVASHCRRRRRRCCRRRTRRNGGVVSNLLWTSPLPLGVLGVSDPALSGRTWAVEQALMAWDFLSSSRDLVGLVLPPAKRMIGGLTPPTGKVRGCFVLSVLSVVCLSVGRLSVCRLSVSRRPACMPA